MRQILESEKAKRLKSFVKFHNITLGDLKEVFKGVGEEQQKQVDEDSPQILNYTILMMIVLEMEPQGQDHFNVTNIAQVQQHQLHINYI